MSATIEYIDNVKEANFLLNRCLNTIDELNNKVDEEKTRVEKYRETNKKLRSKHIELRDYFAAKAMPLVLKNEFWLGTHTFMSACREMPDDVEPEDFLAKCAYQLADAMMKARNG